eukprot:Clim_evm26s246 gene=Clim_evmTU26s246
MVDEKHRKADAGRLDVPERTLMGPGPSNAHSRILSAMSLPLLGHLHPPFLKIMDDTMGMLRYLFQTDNEYTLAVSATGHGAMECGVANLVEPGDKVLVAVTGIWGERVSDMVARYGGEVAQIKADLGKTIPIADLKVAIEKEKPAVLFLCHGESSTGTMQPIEGLSEVCKANNCLLFVDAVCTMGGAPLFVDKWGIDCCYSGSQKALSAPPGASPITFSPRAVEKFKNRKTKVRSYYFDMNLLGRYWGLDGARFYHHTGPISTIYALREAAAIVNEEGLEAAQARHQACADALYAGLEAIGLKPFVENKADRLPTVTTITIPESVKDPMKLLKYLMDNYNLEVSGGLGPTAGKTFRVGLMGHNAQKLNVMFTCEALKDALANSQ